MKKKSRINKWRWKWNGMYNLGHKLVDKCWKSPSPPFQCCLFVFCVYLRPHSNWSCKNNFDKGGKGYFLRKSTNILSKIVGKQIEICLDFQIDERLLFWNTPCQIFDISTPSAQKLRSKFVDFSKNPLVERTFWGIMKVFLITYSFEIAYCVCD